MADKVLLIFSVIAISTIELYALSQGVNGVALSVATGSIGAVAGVAAKSIFNPNNKERRK